MEKRIIVGKVIHDSKELECYVPQIRISNQWRNILSKDSYILKEDYNGNEICSKCNGEGCGECKNMGFRRVQPKDNRHIAEVLLKRANEQYNTAKSSIRISQYPKKSNVVTYDPSESQRNYLIDPNS